MAELQVTLLDVDEGRASRYARELKEYILTSNPGADISQHRTNPEAQDFGASLIIVLGTPAIIAIAQGIRKWVERRGTSRLEFKSDHQTLVIENLTNKSAEAIAKELTHLIGHTDEKG